MMLATSEQQVADLLSRNQGMKYRVLIADDHAIMREGVRALLQSDGSVEVVAAVDNGRKAGDSSAPR
jgi:PleD family two-component response regulator